jgi:hypothetical protein
MKTHESYTAAAKDYINSEYVNKEANRHANQYASKYRFEVLIHYPSSIPEEEKRQFGFSKVSSSYMGSPCLVLTRTWEKIPRHKSVYMSMKNAESLTLKIFEVAEMNPASLINPKTSPYRLWQTWDVSWNQVVWEPIDLDANSSKFSLERVRLVNVTYSFEI